MFFLWKNYHLSVYPQSSHLNAKISRFPYSIRARLIFRFDDSVANLKDIVYKTASVELRRLRSLKIFRNGWNQNFSFYFIVLQLFFIQNVLKNSFYKLKINDWLRLILVLKTIFKKFKKMLFLLEKNSEL